MKRSKDGRFRVDQKRKGAVERRVVSFKLLEKEYLCNLVCGHLGYSRGTGNHGMTEAPKKIRCKQCEEA